ncbi:MAG: hypothetical protein ABI906_03945, partial [Pseudomonadota bacterium]
TVTHGAGTDTVHTLTVGNDAFVVSGGSLRITSSSSFANLLTVSGGTLELGGAATVGRFIQGAGTVSGTGTLAFTAGAQALNSGAILTVARWSISSGAATSVNEILSYGGVFSQDAGSTVTVAAADKLRLTGAATLAGTVSGEGTLTFAGGTQAVDSGATFTVANWVISNAAATTLDATLTYAGAFVQAAGTSLAVDTGDTLALTGPARMAGVLSGAGTLAFAGGTQDLNSGAILTVARWAISGGAATSVNEVLSYGGVFSQDVGTTLTVAAADKLRLTGAGTLTFAGGRQALDTGANFTVANWVINNAAATTLNESLAYAGAFVQAAGTSLTLAGGPLVLTGAARLAGRVDGSGALQLSDAALAGLTLGGAATLNDVGAVDQAGELVFAGGASTALTIGQGAAYRIDTDNGVAVRSSSAHNILNSGLLIKAGGAGVSVIGVMVINSGTIEAASWTLDLTQITTGDGAMTVDTGATLEADGYVAAGLAMTFNGGGAVLALGDPRQFFATINGFAATDTIDLLTAQATRATLKSGDRLVIFNGPVTVASFQLAGDYTGAAFNLAPDGKGGTNITVTGAPPVAPLIAAMAGLGGGGHGPAPAWTPSHADAWRPMLLVPTPVHFV